MGVITVQFILLNSAYYHDNNTIIMVLDINISHVLFYKLAVPLPITVRKKLIMKIKCAL